MEPSWETVTAPVIAPGAHLAGGWIVERILPEVGGCEAYLVTDGAAGRALCFRLSAEAPDPTLDETSAAVWGTVRRILMDDTLGRIVLDEVPEGSLLTDCLAEGWSPGPPWVEQLGSRLRQEHRRDRWHGQIAPDRIVVGAEGVAVAGWGLAEGDLGDLKARDLAAIAAIAGMVGASREPQRESTGEDPSATLPGDIPDAGAGHENPDDAALSAALSSDHVPTLRAAVEEWLAQGGAEDVPEFIKASDALRRLEERIEQQLASAEALIGRGDPLGAVAACREVVRLGAEEQAAPVMKQARKQARQMLAPGGRKAWKIWALTAAGVLALGLVASALWSSMGASSEQAELRRKVAEMVRTRGERDVAAWLLDLRTTGESTPASEELLAEHLQHLVQGEKEKMLGLRREMVAQGARPREADQLAEDALGRIESLVRENFESPLLAAGLSRSLVDLDKAAALYRAGAGVDERAAVEAVGQLLREDPVFVGDHGTEGLGEGGE